MRVLVLGSGVIGTASAYYLARAGFEVVVVDRQDGPALETSFANAGQVSPGYASPWAAPAQLDAAGKDIAVLERSGVPYEVLDRDGIARVEPALAKVADKLVGALRLPNDQTGDCQLFTTRLAEMAKGLGVEFRFGQNIERLDFAGDRINGVLVNGELLTADHYVLALGSYSPQLLKPLGIKAPVYPLKGYSLTVPITNPEMAPTSTILDETYKVAITRFDQRIRVGGMAEIAGFDLSLNPRRRETLEMITTDLYPEGGDISQATFWTGLRPATPDGTPIVGATRYRNLFLNTGHGTLGWTMACGSGRYLADLMAKKRPQISTEGLDISRYSNSPENAKNAHPAPAH